MIMNITSGPPSSSPSLSLSRTPTLIIEGSGGYGVGTVAPVAP